MTIHSLGKQIVVTLLIIVVVHSSVFGCQNKGSSDQTNSGQTNSGQKRTIGRQNLAVLGITLGKSTKEDVERIFGRAEDIAPPQSELSLVCYTSTSVTNQTVLQFVIWDKPVGFRFFRAAPRSKEQCTRTPLVPDNLETQGGLKLGLSRNQVVSIFGRPTAIRGQRYIYDFSYDRPKTPGESERYKGATPPVTEVSITEKLELRFRDSKVDLIDVTYSETF